MVLVNAPWGEREYHLPRYSPPETPAVMLATSANGMELKAAKFKETRVMSDMAAVCLQNWLDNIVIKL